MNENGDKTEGLYKWKIIRIKEHFLTQRIWTTCENTPSEPGLHWFCCSLKVSASSRNASNVTMQHNVVSDFPLTSTLFSVIQTSHS